jgi:hypothetical protein
VVDTAASDVDAVDEEATETREVGKGVPKVLTLLTAATIKSNKQASNTLSNKQS